MRNVSVLRLNRTAEVTTGCINFAAFVGCLNGVVASGGGKMLARLPYLSQTS